MSGEYAAHPTEETPGTNMREAAALAHDLTTDERYFDRLWQEAAKADEDAQTILITANLIANGDPGIRKAIMQGYLAQTALKRRHQVLQELQEAFGGPSVPPQRTKPAA